MQYRHILIASHGTPGAQAAEALALALCARGATLTHLLVVPELWKGMMGDDWLNNVRTRITFGQYLEGQLSREIGEHQQRLAAQAAGVGIDYRPEVSQGEPAQCLLDHAHGLTSCELVVIGQPRPKGVQGLRSRMKLEPLVRGLALPLMVAPYPHG